MWGGNAYGAIGNNSSGTVNYSSPVQTVAGGTNWRSVAVSDNVAAIKTDGTLWTWGDNTYGELGTGNLSRYSSPVQTVAGGDYWLKVSMGTGHTLAITSQ